MHEDATEYSGRPPPRGLCVRWDPATSSKRGRSPPIFGLCLLPPNGCIDQDAARYGGRPRPRLHYVRWGPRSCPQKGGGAPKFSAHVYYGQTAGWIKIVLGTEVRLSPSDFVLDGYLDPPQKGGEAPLFSAHVYCGQTAGWIKMALAIEVGLSPGDFVLDGDTAPPQKCGGAPFPIFGPFLLWPNGWMH